MEKTTEQIEFGRTGLKVCRLGFGGIPIQGVDEKQAVETVLHAVEKGINFIDTARAYTTSERRIGMALQKTDKQVILCSKSKSRTSEGVRADLEVSLKELRVNYIDIYQCHSVDGNDTYRKVISPGGAFDGLVRAKEEGLIGHIGMSAHDLEFVDRVLDDGLFENILICFSFLEPKAQERIIPKAIEKDVGISIMKPLSGGVIENGRLALKYVLAQPGIVIVPGMGSKDLVDENLKVFQDSYELDEEERNEIEESRKEWDGNFCRRCGYCQPCPMGIPISSIMALPYIVRKEGLGVVRAGGRRTEHVEKAGQCSECEECVPRCPYHLSIPELIKENLQWLEEQLNRSDHRRH